MPVRRCEALVLGSGAAGLRAAVELKRRDVDVVDRHPERVRRHVGLLGLRQADPAYGHGADRGDDFRAMADALGAGGAMDEDAAYVEAVGSPRALASLQYLGLPIPQDRLGGVLRYQTDHDEVGRATSCGPRTSRLMVQVLAKEAIRLDVPVINHATGVRILVEPGPPRRVAGALAMRPKHRPTTIPSASPSSSAIALVIAAGGPGELYRDSVYPRHCFGSLGLALEAGIEAVNLTESQFGIGTPRDGFPGICPAPTCSACRTSSRSTRAAGSATSSATITGPRRSSPRTSSAKAISGLSTRRACSSSARASFDLAVFRETQAGRQVFMDFNRNPRAGPGRRAVLDLDRLDADVRAYLGELRRAARIADRPPPQDEPALDRALQALQIRHHAAIRSNSRSTTST